MSANVKVYLVRHFSYDSHENESHVGLAGTQKEAVRLARNNPHVWDTIDCIVWSSDEHERIAHYEAAPHVFIESVQVNIGEKR